MIDPKTIRDANWSDLRGHLAGPREAIHRWLLDHGPTPTSLIADKMGISLFTVRPRVTELVQLGFVFCVGRNYQREGIYQAVPVEQAQATHEAVRAVEAQLALQL